MNHANKFVSAALATLLFTGCATSGTASTKAAATKEDYLSALSDAKNALKKAGKAHYEWRDSGKMLIKAAKTAQTGDYATATKLALKVKRQGELAFTQSQTEANAGPRP